MITKWSLKRVDRSDLKICHCRAPGEGCCVTMTPVREKISADMTYAARLPTQQVQREAETLAGANKKTLRRTKGAFSALPRKFHPQEVKLCLWSTWLHHGPLGRTRSMLLSRMDSMHTIVTAGMTWGTEQEKLHLVPMSWNAQVINWPTCHLSPSCV